MLFHEGIEGFLVVIDPPGPTHRLPHGPLERSELAAQAQFTHALVLEINDGGRANLLGSQQHADQEDRVAPLPSPLRPPRGCFVGLGFWLQEDSLRRRRSIYSELMV